MINIQVHGVINAKWLKAEVDQPRQLEIQTEGGVQYITLFSARPKAVTDLTGEEDV